MIGWRVLGRQLIGCDRLARFYFPMLHTFATWTDRILLDTVSIRLTGYDLVQMSLAYVTVPDRYRFRYSSALSFKGFC